MKQCGCLTAFMLLFTVLFGAVVFSPTEPDLIIIHPIIEEPEEIEMKYENFTLVASTNNDLEDNLNMRNIHGYNNSLYFCKLTGSPFTVNILSTPNTLIGSSTTEDTVMTIKPTGSINDIVVRGWEDEIHWAIMDTDDAIQPYILTVRSGKSLDGGATWTDATYETAPVDNTDGEIQIIDIFRSGADVYYVYSYDNKGATLNYVGITKNMASDIIITDNPTVVDSVYSGYVNDDGDYIFIIYDGANFKKVTYDVGLGTDSSVSLTGITAPASWDVNTQQYWRQGNYEWIIDEDHFYIRQIGTTTWGSFSDTGTTTNGIIWDNDDDGNYIITYIVWKDSLYKVLESGLPVKIQTFTEDAYVGWSNWIANGADAIYQMTWTDIGYIDGTTKTELYKISQSRVTSLIEPIQDQYIIIADDDEVVFSRSIVDGYTTDSARYGLLLYDPVKKDLQRKISATYVGQTVTYILKDIIDTYCQYLWYDAGIETDATTYDKSWKDKRIIDVFRWADTTEGRQTSIRVDHEVYWDTYSLTPWDYKIGKTGVIQWGTESNPDLTDWTDVITMDTFEIVDSYLNHKNLMHFQHDTNGIWWYYAVDTQTSGSVEFFVIPKQVDKTDYFIVGASGSLSTYVCRCIFKPDGYIDFQGTATDGDLVAYTADTLYHVKMDFINNGACTLTVNGAVISTGVITGRAYDVLGFYSWGEANSEYYLDAIGISANGYVAGDNQLMIYDSNVSVPKLTPLTGKKYGRFLLFGGFKDGVRLESELVVDPNLLTYTDEYSEIVDQTELDAVALKLSTRWNLAVQQLTLTIFGQGFIQPGTDVLVTISQYSISGETWYVFASDYDAVRKRCDLILLDAVIQPSIKDEVNTNISNLRQDVATVEAKTTWTWRDPVSYDWYKTSLAAIGDVASTWYDLDLSSIVGAKKMLVNVRILIRDGAASSVFLLRTNGQTNIKNRGGAYTQVANINLENTFLIETDSAGKIEFYADPKPSDWTVLRVFIRGYRDA